MNVKNDTMKDVEVLPKGIINLEYSNKQRLFHFDDTPGTYRDRGWVKLKAMSIEDAESFSEGMEKKYVKGRKSRIGRDSWPIHRSFRSR